MSKKNSFRFNSVKARLIAIMLLVSIVPLTVSIAISYFSSTSKATADAKDSIAMEANYIEAEFHSIVLNTQTALKAIASSETTLDFLANQNPVNEKAVKKQMLEVNNCFDDNNAIVLSDASGMMVLRSDDNNLTDISKREYFQKALAGEENVSEVIISTSTGTRSISIAVPVWDRNHNKVIGCLHRNYDLNNFHELLAANAKEAFLIDNKGILAAHSQYEIAAEDEPQDFSKSPYMTSGKTTQMHRKRRTRHYCPASMAANKYIISISSYIRF